MKTRVVVLFTALVLSHPVSAQDLTKLLQRIPESANMITVIDAKRLMATPKAQTEGWTEKRMLDYLSGKIPFPPSLKLAVIASDMVPAEHRNNWKIGLYQFSEKVYEDKLANREGSRVESIENHYVIPSRKNMYFVQFDHDDYAVYCPANRQKMIHWLRFTKANTENKVHTYLTEAVTSGGSFGQINIAIDLSNTLDRVETVKRLQSSKAVSASGMNVNRMADFLTGIQGLRLSIHTTDTFQARLQVDFKDAVETYAAVLPGFLMESLDSIGLQSGDMYQWQSEARGRTLTMKGGLNDDDVRKLMSKIIPTMADGMANPNLSGEALIGATSQSYYKAVNTLLQDLRQRADRLEKSQSWNSNASWYEYTINKLDSLPVVNTDEKLVKLTNEVADQLRLCADSLRGVDIESKVIDSYKREGLDTIGAWGGYYYGGYSSNRQDVETSKIENAAKFAKQRNATWVKIGEKMSDIRGELSNKYRIEF